MQQLLNNNYMSMIQYQILHTLDKEVGLAWSLSYKRRRLRPPILVGGAASSAAFQVASRFKQE